MQSQLVAMVNGNKLLFSMSCTLDLTKASVVLSLSMEGAWQGAFGIGALTLSNLIGSISLGPPTGITALMLGGTLTIGQYPTTASNADQSITGSMYFNLDFNSPSNNWFYGSITSLTIGNFMSVLFGVKGLPSIVANSGFPQGLTISYAAAPATVPVANIEIPSGFRLAGGFNFMGFGGFGEVVVSPTQFMFNITMNPLKLGTLQISRTKEDPSIGPNMYLSSTVSPAAFTASMDGYVNLFLFQGYCKMEITTTSFSIDYQTTLFLIFDGRIKVTASYGSTNDFAVSFLASLTTNSIKQGIVDAINSFRNQATGAFDRAQSEIKAAQDRVNNQAEQTFKDCQDKCKNMCNFLELEGEQSAVAMVETEANQSVEAEVDTTFEAQMMQEVMALASLSLEEMQAMGMVASNEELAQFQAEAAHVAHLEAMMPIQSLSEVDEHIRQGVALMQLEEAMHLEVAGALDAYTELQAEMAARAEHAHQGWGDIGKAFQSVGNAIKSGVQKLGNDIKSGAQKLGNQIKSGVQKLGNDIKSGAQKLGNDMKGGLEKAGNVMKKGFEDMGRGACKEVGQKTCYAGCDAAKGTIKAGAEIVKFGGMALQPLQQALAAVLKFIADFLNNLDINIVVGGGLSTQAFSFMCEFHVKLASFKLDFNLSFNFQVSKLADMINMLWVQIKSFMLKSIPGLDKLGIH